MRTARYPTAVDLPQAYINRVIDREQAQALELAQAHNAPMITDSDDNDTVA